MTLSDRTRGLMMPWGHSTSSSTVVYPNSALAMERHGFFPFERFAYNALRTGAEVLHAAGLPDATKVSMDGMEGMSPWALGARVYQSTSGNGNILGYRLETSPFTPPTLFGLTSRIKTSEASIPEALASVGKALWDGIEKTKSDGLGPGLVVLRDELELSLESTQDALWHFDIACQFLVNHEFAHAYLQRYSWYGRDETNADRRAFELLADLVAVGWMYSKNIVNTPDSPSYREFRGVSDHQQAIRENAEVTLYSHMLVLAFLALSSAIQTDGRVDLDGGPYHPHTYIRHMFWDSHFATLVLSNYEDAFTSAQAESLGSRAKDNVGLLLQSGLIRPDDVEVLFTEDWKEDCERAASLAETHDVPELRHARELLLQVLQFDLPRPPNGEDRA